MEKPVTRIKIPEFEDLFERYGVSWEDEPSYVIVAAVKTPLAGRQVGILGFVSNQFHAYLLRQKLRSFGLISIERTKYHPDAKEKYFDVEGYFRKL